MITLTKELSGNKTTLEISQMQAAVLLSDRSERTQLSQGA